MTTYKNFWEAAPFVAGGALLLGGGARVSKGLIDLLRRPDPEGSPELITRTEDPVAEVPVPVTKEEAEELRRQGVRVKKAGFLDKFDVGTSDAFLLGGLGTGAVMGGWALTDKLVDSYRKSRAEAKREAVRRRIQKLLSDSPAPEDSGLYAQMKAAECMHFSLRKVAWFNPQTTIVNPLAALLGGSALLAGIRAYQKSIATAPESAKVKALKSYLKRQKTTQPLVAAVPVEMPEGGSPAQQAAQNAVLERAA